MNKNILAIALVATLSVPAFADESNNGIFVSIDSGTLHTNGNNATRSLDGFSAGYRYFITDKFSVEAVASNAKASGLDMNTLQAGIGYDLPISESLTIRPKFRFGQLYVRNTIALPGQPDSKQADAHSLGFEVVYKKNFSAEFTYKELSGSGIHANTQYISLNYKF